MGYAGGENLRTADLELSNFPPWLHIRVIGWFFWWFKTNRITQFRSRGGWVRARGGRRLRCGRSPPGQPACSWAATLTTAPRAPTADPLRHSRDRTPSSRDPVRDPRMNLPHRADGLNSVSLQLCSVDLGQFEGKRAQNNILSGICNPSKTGDFTQDPHTSPHPGAYEPTVLVIK